jgi:hypothetical protein
LKTFIDHVLEDLNKYRRMMEAEHAELVHMLPNRDGVASEKSPDDLDEVQ